MNENEAKHEVLSAVLHTLGEEQEEAQALRGRDGGMTAEEWDLEERLRERERGSYEPLRTRWVSLWDLRNQELENEAQDYLGLLDPVQE